MNIRLRFKLIALLISICLYNVSYKPFSQYPWKTKSPASDRTINKAINLKPIDFKTYNKLLTSELEARNIVTEHELVTIYKPNNGDEKGWMHLDKPERFTTWKNPVHFDYPLHNESTLQYRLFRYDVSCLQLRG